MAGTIDDFEELFQIVARGFLAGEGAEEDRELSNKVLILEHVLRDAPGIDGGVIEEFEPVLGTLLEAKLFRPRAQRVLIARRGKDLALNFTPVARVVAVFLAEFAQTQPLSRPQFFDEGSKHIRITVVLLLPRRRTAVHRILYETTADQADEAGQRA